MSTLKISQRGFTTAIVFLIALGLGAMAIYGGYRLPSLRNVTVDEVLSFFLPLTGVIFILNQFFDVVDAKIADNTLVSGDWMALFKMPMWYATVVSCTAGVFQFFGGEALSPDTQVLIVNLLQAFVFLLLRSFSDRLPTPTPTQQKAA